MSNLVYFDLLRLQQKMFQSNTTKENQSKQCEGVAKNDKTCGHIQTKENENHPRLKAGHLKLYFKRGEKIGGPLNVLEKEKTTTLMVYPI